MSLRARAALVLLAPLATAPAPAAADAIETAGDVLEIALPIAAAGAALGYRDAEGGIDFAKGLALTAASTFVLKYALDTTRPDGGRHSMPSGHASIAFSGASFLQRRYGWRFGVPAYAAAAFVAYSRVESDRHHVQDVIVGAAIGIASTYLFTRPYEAGFVVAPIVGGGTYGLHVSGRW